MATTTALRAAGPCPQLAATGIPMTGPTRPPVTPEGDRPRHINRWR